MARRDPHARKLKSLERFSDLSDKDVQKIAEAGTYVHEPADWTLMAEGTGADKAYLILSGEVSVRHQGKEIATLGAGDTVGEMGIIGKKLRAASVVSTTPLEVLHFTRERLEELATALPAFGEALRASTSSRQG
jgi:CRP/FNR family cyclic AMP-dependent transcriptional regulator